MRRLFVLLSLLLLPLPARAQGCEDDRRLSRAAAALLLEGGAPSRERVLVEARRAGSQLPVVHALLTREEPRRRRAFLARIAARAHAPLRCGEARSEGRVLVLAGPAAGRLRVERGAVRITLAEGWSDPVLYLRDADGRARAAPVRSRRVELPRDLAEPFDLQLVATGPDGPRPVAERRSAEPAGRTAGDGPVEARLAQLRGGRELRANRLLGRVADAHAARICARGRVAHVDEQGDPRERLARAGIRARHVGETAARSPSEAEAFDAMVRSPSHRAALTDRRFTDVGFGRARDRRGRACLVVLLASWPRAVPYR